MTIAFLLSVSKRSAFALSVLLAGGTAHAATVVLESDQFSLNYGFGGSGASGAQWVSNPSASTTSTTLGDFGFTLAFTDIKASDYGATFANGVLSNGALQYSYAGYSTGWTATVNAAWTGILPPDAAASPNVKISLIIDSMSIYGLVNSSQSPSTNFAFSELTAGHAANSPAITVTALTSSQAPAGYMVASNYTQLVWNPDDYFVDGSNMSRIFKVTDNRVIDGFQISGRVQITYETIPEPGTYALMGGAVFVLFGFHNRWKAQQAAHTVARR